jgi:hypothetical protein
MGGFARLSKYISQCSQRVGKFVARITYFTMANIAENSHILLKTILLETTCLSVDDLLWHPTKPLTGWNLDDGAESHRELKNTS